MVSWWWSSDEHLPHSICTCGSLVSVASRFQSYLDKDYTEAFRYSFHYSFRCALQYNDYAEEMSPFILSCILLSNRHIVIFQRRLIIWRHVWHEFSSKWKSVLDDIIWGKIVKLSTYKRFTKTKVTQSPKNAWQQKHNWCIINRHVALALHQINVVAWMQPYIPIGIPRYLLY